MNITITYHYIILILPLYAYLTYYYIDSYYYFITHFTRQAINWVPGGQDLQCPRK